MRPRSLCRWLVKKNWTIPTFLWKKNIIIFCFNSLVTATPTAVVPYLRSTAAQIGSFFSTDETVYSVAIAARATNASWIQMDFVDVHLNGIELRSNRRSSLWFYCSGIWISSISPKNKWSHQLRPSSTWWMSFNLSICDSLNVMSGKERNFLSSVLPGVRFVQIRSILNVIDAICYLYSSEIPISFFSLGVFHFLFDENGKYDAQDGRNDFLGWASGGWD